MYLVELLVVMLAELVLLFALLCGAFVVVAGRARWSATQTLEGLKARLAGMLIVVTAGGCLYLVGLWMKLKGWDK